jgi:hypothetical protein
MDNIMWNAAEGLWNSGTEVACGAMPVQTGANLVCNLYTQQEPPGGYGWCIGANVTGGLLRGASGCAVYTRDDGLVFTGATQEGYSAGAGAGISTGPMLTSSTSAEGLGGTGKGGGVDFGLGEFVSVGASGAVADGSGDWTVGLNAGIGAGACVFGPVCVSYTEETAHAVTFDEVVESAVTSWPYLDDMFGRWDGL